MVTGHPAALHYRPDIDGLRAVAVLLVLGFHAGLTGVSGGFVGVDVFFVISGYLITGLLLAEHRRSGTISLVAFWSRRVRRLAPALLLVVATALALAPLLLQRVGGETETLARAAIATLLLNANHYFLQQSSDYFAPAAEINPMLHMWSLSVEEQFYVVWPLLLLLALRRGQGMARPVAMVGVVLLGSFALALYLTATAPLVAFFLAPSRAWEFAAGAVLAAGQALVQAGAKRWAGGALGLAGLALIVGAGVGLNGVRHFPAPMALIPVLGAVLFLAAGVAAPRNPVSRAASARWLVYTGRISYPLYLWHWPVLAFMRSLRLYEKSLPLDLLGLGLSFVLAALTHEWVERRLTRRALQMRPGRIIAWGAGGTLVLLLAATLLGAWARFRWGYSERERPLAAARADAPETGCLSRDGGFERLVAECFPSSDKASVLLWGDSHAEHWGPAVRAGADALGVRAGILTFSGCPPLPGFSEAAGCSRWNDQVFGELPTWAHDRHLRGLVLSARWPRILGLASPALTEQATATDGETAIEQTAAIQEAFDGFEQSLDGLLARAGQLGLRVLIVLPSPIQRIAGPHCLAVRAPEDCFVSRAAMAAYAGPVEVVIRKVATRHGNTRLLDPKDFLCRDGLCPAQMDNVVVYRDEGHISNTAARANAQAFRAGMQWLVSSR
jgi:peptidoglycan/LPS O-acetylase OafA/YrhL